MRSRDVDKKKDLWHVMIYLKTEEEPIAGIARAGEREDLIQRRPDTELLAVEFIDGHEKQFAAEELRFIDTNPMRPGDEWPAGKEENE